MKINLKLNALTSLYGAKNNVKVPAPARSNSKPLTMDTLSLSSQLSAALNSLTSTEAASNIRPSTLIEEGRKISGAENRKVFESKALDKAYAAKGGINRVKSILQEMQALTEEVNREENPYSSRDRTEFQRELNNKMKDMDRISEALESISAEYTVKNNPEMFHPAYQMDRYAMGVADLDVSSRESTIEAMNALKLSVKTAAAKESDIDQMIAVLETGDSAKAAEMATTALISHYMNSPYTLLNTSHIMDSISTKTD